MLCNHAQTRENRNLAGNPREIALSDKLAPHGHSRDAGKRLRAELPNLVDVEESFDKIIQKPFRRKVYFGELSTRISTA